MKRNLIISLILTGTVIYCSNVWADERVTISAEEFHELKAGYEKLQLEVKDLQMEVAKQREVAPPLKRTDSFTVEDFNRLKRETDAVRPGETNFVLGGYSAAGYEDASGRNSTFNSTFNPIFLYNINDRMLFEGELEIALEGSETAVDLEYAQLTYILNDYMTVGAGKFLNPFGIFTQRLHPAWINKLPDKPLGYAGDGLNKLVPEAQVGVQVQGAVPLWWNMRSNYALWLSNGPGLGTDEENAGSLNLGQHIDNNDNKAFGTRIGLLAISDVEVGYSFQYARVGDSGTEFNGLDSVLQGVDLSYVHNSKLLKGAIDLRSEFILSHLQPADYGTDAGKYRNNRHAYYVQLAYRPTFGSDLLQRFEPVLRFDAIDLPKPTFHGQDEERWTMGLDYHLSASSVVKAAYRLNQHYGAEDENKPELLLQWAMGF